MRTDYEIHENDFLNGDMWPSARGPFSLCRSCVYNSSLRRPVGFTDEPRLKGVYLNGHAEGCCATCSANPSYSLFYASRGRCRRLKGIGSTTLLRLHREQ